LQVFRPSCPRLGLSRRRQLANTNGKIVFSIVNNIEYGYHPKKWSAKPGPTQTASGYRGDNGEETA
jgi:hypothetical protein